MTLREKAEAEVERHWKNDPAPETGDEACELVRKTYSAGYRQALADVMEKARWQITLVESGSYITVERLNLVITELGK